MKKILELHARLLRGLAPWLKHVLIGFLACTAIGAVAFFFYPDLLNTIAKLLEDKIGADRSLDFGLVQTLFLNNTQAALIALFGSIIMGLTAAITVATNGFLLGYVVTAIIAVGTGSPFYAVLTAIATLVPHGIFELPALWVAGAAGLRLGIHWLSREAQGRRGEVWRQDFREAVQLTPLILILLALAALIEVYVTGNIAEAL